MLNLIIKSNSKAYGFDQKLDTVGSTPQCYNISQFKFPRPNKKKKSEDKRGFCEYDLRTEKRSRCT